MGFLRFRAGNCSLHELTSSLSLAGSSSARFAVLKRLQRLGEGSSHRKLVASTATARQRIASTGGSLSDMRHGNCAEQDAGSHLPVLTTASRLRRLPCELRRREF